MIHRALLYLLWMRLKNGFFGPGRARTRLVAMVLLFGLFVAMRLTSESGNDMDVATRLNVLVAILALYLVLSVFGGLGESGPIFRPSDVEFVFPAPFRRHDVLVYYLLRHYLQMLFLGLFYAVFLGAARLPNPVLAYVGIVLCLIVCSQLQTAMTLVGARVSERLFGRLKLAARVALVGALAVAAVFAIVAASGSGDVPKMLGTILATTVARVVLYPAVAVGQLAVAPDTGAVLLALLGLLACVVGSFVFVLFFPVNFLETATTRGERKRRAAGPGADRARSVGAAPSFFTGAGAVVWLNALTLRRRLRMIVAALVMLLMVMLFAGVRSQGEGASGPPPVLILLAFFPLIVQLPLGFKGHREYLESLKTLPVTPLKLSWAEVMLPAIVLWLLQAAIVGVFAVVGRLEVQWAVAALVVYPVIDVGVTALSDLFQLGHDRRDLNFLLVTAQMMAMAASLMPAVFVGMLVWALTAEVLYAGAAAILIHMGVDAILLRLLARRFRVWEPTAGP